MRAYTVALETLRRAATSAGVRKAPPEGREAPLSELDDILADGG